MAENGYGTVGHAGRIPSYGKTQVNPMGYAEAPACIQNAMMTKDKKPFTYTPGGLDLSQIRTPSMARRMARQRSQEEHEQAYTQPPHYQQPAYQPQGASQGGPVPPPPPPPQVPAPPPPPPLVIKAPNANSPKPVALGERPEIVIPENPIGMLRKTNSPYHWEAEKADNARMGPVPKFVEKVPSPLSVKMPPSTFSQQPPQQYVPQNNQRQNYQQPESPIHKPEAQYGQKFSPVSVSPPTRENLQRQDSQFNKSPIPFNGQSPSSNGSAFSPSPNSSWKQPERRDSSANNVNHSPLSPQFNRGPMSPNNQPSYQTNSPPVNNSPAFNTLRTTPKPQANNTIYNNVSQASQPSPRLETSEPAPWRTNTTNANKPKANEPQPNIYHNSPPVKQQPNYTPPWKTQEANNNQTPNQWKQESKPQNNQQNQPQQNTWVSQENNRNRDPCSPPWRAAQESRPVPPPKPTPQPPQEQRFQSSMTIPVTQRQPKQEPPRTQSPQRECVYVNQEPVYYCPESPKSIPPWVKTQKEKTKTPPPEWCQRPLDGRKSVPRDLVTPPRDSEPEWVKKSNEMQRNIRDVVSPPRTYQQPQPTWSTKPSDNRKSVPKDNPPEGRFIPVQESQPEGPPHLRITIGLQPAQHQSNPQGPFSQPTQRIMRVLSPQLVRMDEGQSQHELPSLTRSFDGQEGQHKTRIIPIQIEGGNGGNRRVYFHKFTQEGPPRQSKAFRVLQVITGTQDDVDSIENTHSYSDL